MANKVRTVKEYLTMLELAGRSPYTIKNYMEAFVSYAKFLNIPVDQIHMHSTVENLMAYAASTTGRAKSGRKGVLSILHRYMKLNGVEFDELEYNATKVTSDEDRDDKPLELETLQKMMDSGDPHSRAILAFLTSTGCRAGETCKILLSDVNGDVVNVRNEIAKRRKGGKVFLTAEAREYLDLWLRERDAYIAKANKMTSRLFTAPTHHKRIPRKGTGRQVSRPVVDQRLFACAYTTMDKIFGRLYRRVDGERGKYRAKVTSHSCRAYFRTRAPAGMSIDLVEGILRHTGYLNTAYVKMTDDEKRTKFHDGEHTLYITRKDHRVQQGELDDLRQKLKQLEEREEDKKMFSADLKIMSAKEKMALAEQYLEQLKKLAESEDD